MISSGLSAVSASLSGFSGQFRRSLLSGFRTFLPPQDNNSTSGGDTFERSSES